jgi:hypothetical protein
MSKNQKHGCGLSVQEAMSHSNNVSGWVELSDETES